MKCDYCDKEMVYLAHGGMNKETEENWIKEYYKCVSCGYECEKTCHG